MNPGNPTTEEQEDIDLGRVPPDLGCNPTTTGEQVAQQIWANSLSGASREVQFKAAVNAINAALAAAYEKGKQDEQQRTINLELDR